MPMTPPPSGSRGAEADVERARQVIGGRPSGPTRVVPRKTVPVVQAVVAEEERQMVMDFGSPVADAEVVGVVDEAQIRSAVDGLDEMEAMLREGDGENNDGRSPVEHAFSAKDGKRPLSVPISRSQADNGDI